MGSAEPPHEPRLLVVRLQTEDLSIYAQQSEANLLAWCDGCSEFGWRCDYRLFRSVPIARSKFHPFFARFFAARLAILHHHGISVEGNDRNVTWLSDGPSGERDEHGSGAAKRVVSTEGSRYAGVLFADPDVVFVGQTSPEAFLTAFWANQTDEARLAPLAFFAASELDSAIDPGCFMVRPDIVMENDTHTARSYERAVALLAALDEYQPAMNARAAEVHSTGSSQQPAVFGVHNLASTSHPFDGLSAPTSATRPFAQGQVELFELESMDAATSLHMERPWPSYSSPFLRDANRTACGSGFRMPRGDGSPPPLLWRYSMSCSIVELAQHLKVVNVEQRTPSPPLAAENPFTPVIGLVAYGEKHNRQETPHFLRSLFSHRSLPLKVITIGDAIGLETLFDVMANAALVDLLDDRDEIRFINMDVLPRWLEIERLIHVHTKQRHPRLFVKLFTHDLFPHISKIMMLDSDLLVMEDIKNLWAEFELFAPENIVAMAIDQSNRWYFRFQDPLDEIYSPGWAGLANRCGVNGGIQLWHNDHIRRSAPNWSYTAVKLTHTGAHRSTSDLLYFGILQEQDLLNVAIIDNPRMWKPLDCVWNYLPKTVGPHGGHVTETAKGTLSTFIDRCYTHHAHSAEQPELFGCSCGRKVRILHFVGMTKESNPQAHLLFQFWGHAPLRQLRAIVHQNTNARDDPGAGRAAFKMAMV
jgi:hypothetical protein